MEQWHNRNKSYTVNTLFHFFSFHVWNDDLEQTEKALQMAVSYAGLPGKRCSDCSGVLFSRIGNEISCCECRPIPAGIAVDEYLESSYQNGILRWSVTLSPELPTEPTLWLYVADDLDFLECEPSEKIAEVCHIGPASAGRWYRRLDRRLFAWFVERVQRVKAHYFAEDFEDVIGDLRAVAQRAIEVGVFAPSFADESRWPRASGGLDPFEGLPDLSQIQFSGLGCLPVATETPNPFAGLSRRNQ